MMELQGAAALRGHGNSMANFCEGTVGTVFAIAIAIHQIGNRPDRFEPRPRIGPSIRDGVSVDRYLANVDDLPSVDTTKRQDDARYGERFRCVDSR